MSWLITLLFLVNVIGAWHIQSRAGSSESKKIWIALKQRNIDLLEKKILVGF